MLAALRSPTIRGCCGASCDQRGVLHLRQAPQGLWLYPKLGRLPRVAVERCRHIPNRDRRRTDTDLTISSALPSPTPAFSRANPPNHLPAREGGSICTGAHKFHQQASAGRVGGTITTPNSFCSPRVASQGGSIRCVHEVRREEKRCLSSLRLLTWR